MISPHQYLLYLCIQISKLPNQRVVLLYFEDFEQTEYCVHTVLIDSTSTAAANFRAYEYLVLLLLEVLQGQFGWPLFTDEEHPALLGKSKVALKLLSGFRAIWLST